MKKALTAFLLTSALATSPLFAQGPGNGRGPGRMVDRRVNMLTTFLSLTPNQQTQATTIFTSAGASAAAVRVTLQSARQSLANAEKTNDTAAIDQAAATIGNLTAQLTAAESKANAAFYQTLTPDQQTKLNQIQNMRRGQFGGTGPGGQRPPL